MAQPKAEKTTFADVGNRVGAMLLDLIFLIFITSRIIATGLPHSIVFLTVAFAYFWGMPLTALQGTLGKWICRIKICSRSGQRLSWHASAVRAFLMLCWCGLGFYLVGNEPPGEILGVVRSVCAILIFLPLAPTGFLPRRESLIDLLAGSLVVRYNTDTEAIAQAAPAQKSGILNVSGGILACLLCGLGVELFIDVGIVKDRRVRTGYAVMQTQSLREKVESFHDREQRWPAASALGVEEWTPYPAGGGYRLQVDGSILISFAVLPGLKGHNMILRPTITSESRKIRWQCSADPGFTPRFLPPNCR
jgi:uncharacterized RDD family membrane protein YckC